MFRPSIIAAIGIASILAISTTYLTWTYFPSKGNSTSNSTSSVTTTTTFSSNSIPHLVVRVPPGGTGSLQIRYFYHNPAATITVIAADRLSFHGFLFKPDGVSVDFDVTSNFSITATPSMFEIGGPQNQNEGVVVTYVISAPSVSNGTYEIGIRAISLPRGAGCSSYGAIVVGNGIPSYVGPSTCFMAVAGGVGPPPYPSGILFFSYNGSH